MLVKLVASATPLDVPFVEGPLCLRPNTLSAVAASLRETQVLYEMGDVSHPTCRRYLLDNARGIQSHQTFFVHLNSLRLSAPLFEPPAILSTAMDSSFANLRGYPKRGLPLFVVELTASRGAA